MIDKLVHGIDRWRKVFGFGLVGAKSPELQDCRTGSALKFQPQPFSGAQSVTFGSRFDQVAILVVQRLDGLRSTAVCKAECDVGCEADGRHRQ